MWNRIVKGLATLAEDVFVCIYCPYSGTYNDVQAHQSSAHSYGSR